jgi:hypothetical protein
MIRRQRKPFDADLHLESESPVGRRIRNGTPEEDA